MASGWENRNWRIGRFEMFREVSETPSARETVFGELGLHRLLCSMLKLQKMSSVEKKENRQLFAISIVETYSRIRPRLLRCDKEADLNKTLGVIGYHVSRGKNKMRVGK